MDDEVDLAAGFAGTLDVHTRQGTARGYTDLTLTAGRIDWQAEEYFGRYHCHWLSSALSGLTGWQQTTFEVCGDDGTWKPVHSGVLAPTGRVLDIFGERDQDSVERFYSDAHGGRAVRQRRVDPADMPGQVIADLPQYRGDRHWWARELPDAGRAAYLHFARLVLDDTGYHRHPDAPPPAREVAATHRRMVDPVDTTAAVMTVDGFGATCRRGLTSVELRPDEVTDSARELFGHRQCALLAVELHRRTGWPLALIERDKPEQGWGWDHVAVRHPSGDLVDIDGQRSPDRLMADRAADGYSGAQRVRDLDGEADLRAELSVGPAVTGPAWHIAAAGFPAFYRQAVVARLAEAVLRDHTSPHTPDQHTPEAASHSAAADPTPSPASTLTATPGGSPAMSGIDEVKHALNASNERARQAANALQQARSLLEDVHTTLAQVTQNSAAEEVAEAGSVYSQLCASLTQQSGQIMHATDAIETYLHRL